MIYAAPDPRPVSKALLALVCAASGRDEEAVWWVRRLIDGCHAEDGEEA